MINIAFFQGHYDNQVREPAEYSWEELVEFCSVHRRTKDKNDVGFILGKFKPAEEAVPAKVAGDKTGLRRVAGTVAREGQNIIEMDCLVVDYDGGAGIEEAQEALAGLRHLGYTSFNHLKGGKTEKFRVVLPFDKPCPATEWKRRFRNFLPLFPGADQSTFSLGRIFFTPSTPAAENRPVQFWQQEGEPFSWEQVPAEEERLAVTRPVGTKSGTGPVLPGTLDALALFLEAGLDPTLVDAAQGKYLVNCPNEYQHSTAGKSGTVIWSGVPGKRDGFYCAHSHCQGLSLRDLFSKEQIERHCEREEPGLVFTRKPPHTEQEAEQVPREVVRPAPPREFTLPANLIVRKGIVRDFVKAFLRKDMKTHAVLRTPEGYGKSTMLVKELVEAHRDVLFCCSSNEQANKKLEEFKEYGASRAWGTGALIEHELGIRPAFGPAGTGEWGVPALDETGTIEIIAEKLGCGETNAAAALLELKEKASASREVHQAGPVVVTTFAIGSLLFNNALGRLGRVIIVDDPSASNLSRFAFEMNEQDVPVQIESREIEEVEFGRSYAWQDKIIWTTTEAVVTETIRRQHQGALVHEVRENLDTGNQILLHSTPLVRRVLKRILPCVDACVAEDTRTEQHLIANGVQAKLNLVSTKGRNDLRGDSTIIISYPHPAEVAAVTATMEREENERNEVLAQMVTDVCDQAVGRAQGYRSEDFVPCRTLVLCDPQLEVALLCRSRYRLNGIDGLKRRGRLHGVPLEWAKDIPDWWSAWFGYLATWQEFVVAIGGHIYETLSMRKLSISADEVQLFEKRLRKPLPFGKLVWKAIKETFESEDEEARRDFTELMHELVSTETRSRTGEHLKELNKKPGQAKGKHRGKRKFIGPNGEAKLFLPGSEPAGWSQKKNRHNS